MMTMIERVARAICAVEYGDENAGWENQIPAARAAIEAMRRPTEAMKAGLREVAGTQTLAYALASWPTMIDAALKEGPNHAG